MQPQSLVYIVGGAFVLWRWPPFFRRQLWAARAGRILKCARTR